MDLPTPSRARMARALRLSLAVVLLLGVAGAVAIALFVRGVHGDPRLPDVSQLLALQAMRPSVVLSADGVLLTRFAREQREPQPLSQVPSHLIHALLATEDHRFCQHRGVDWFRSAAALWHTARGDPQGGSTLTQQLARNAFPAAIGRERSLDRKLREMATALEIERRHSKGEILEAYLNSAPFLHQVVGVEMAARVHFDKPVAALDVAESALLVAMLKGGAAYHPVRQPQRAKARRDLVLAQMARHGLLDRDEARRLATAPLPSRVHLPADPAEIAPHYVQRLRQQVQAWADQAGRDLERDGLVVRATLDTRLQRAAAAAVERQADALQAVADVEWSERALPRMAALESYAQRAAGRAPFAHFWQQQPALLDEAIEQTPEFRAAVERGATREAALRALRADAGFIERVKRARTRLEVGFVALDPASGAVRAWVGSRDFALDQFDHVAQARRQPGSTFKPFVYAAALDADLTPSTLFWDAPVEVVQADGQRWQPADSGAPAMLPLSMREALARSRNGVTVQVSQTVGAARVAAIARTIGSDASPLETVPSLALGTSPVTLLEMTGAYATIAAQGVRRVPRLIERIDAQDGTPILRFDDAKAREGVRVLPASLANDLLGMMRAVVDEGTGRSLRSRFALAGDLAGKTGTSQDNADGWFILMRPDLVAGAWVGFNDQRVTLRSAHWGQSSRNALPMVGDFVREALRSRLVDAKARFPSPRRERAGADPNRDALVTDPMLPNGQWHFVPGFEPPSLLPPLDDGGGAALLAPGAILRSADSGRGRDAPISEAEWMIAFPQLREIGAAAR